MQVFVAFHLELYYTLLYKQRQAFFPVKSNRKIFVKSDKINFGLDKTSKRVYSQYIPPVCIEKGDFLMARNKYPEETVKKILDVATKLFLKQGYDNTSMQDIVDALGMSKGAVYHHFKSKEDLFEKTIIHYYSQGDWFEKIVTDPSKNGLEKLKALFHHEMSDEEKLSVDQLYFTRINDSRVLLENMRVNIKETAPVLAKIIEEGNRDGSLSVAQPLETAELTLLMANVWIGMFADSKEKFISQVMLCKQVTNSLGLPLLDDELTAQMITYYDETLSMSQNEKVFSKDSSVGCAIQNSI